MFLGYVKYIKYLFVASDYSFSYFFLATLDLASQIANHWEAMIILISIKIK